MTQGHKDRETQKQTKEYKHIQKTHTNKQTKTQTNKNKQIKA